MSEQIDKATQMMDAAAIKTIGIGAGGVGIGYAQWLELAQSGLAFVGTIAGSILVIWTLCDKIRLTYKKSRRKTDVRKGDNNGKC